MNTKQKLSALRGLMAEAGVDAYFIPATDPHNNEYVPACWQRRAFASGFTGSYGDLLVLRDAAALWTDGRYFLQAEAELKGSAIALQKIAQPGVPTLMEYIGRRMKAGQKLGADPRVLSLAKASEFEQALATAGASLQLVDANLVDRIWKEQPAVSGAPIMALPITYTGKSTAAKLSAVRKEMKAVGADALVVTTLDSIAWLYNIRGRDVEYNPVVTSYALVTMKEAHLFVAEDKVTPAVAKKLGAAIRIRPYEAFEGALRDQRAARPTVWVDGATVSRWVVDLLAGCKLVTETSPIVPMKARKNEVEIEGMRACHIRDGAAVVRYLHWLDREVAKGRLTEISASDQLERLRSEGDLFQGLSFASISGYAAHGAIIHYRASESSDVPLEAKGLYVIDSGGQYLDGTTDITRTVLLGKSATREQRDRFTRVLKGHIALARAKFPSGVRGIRLDTLARLPLWEAGLDYNHGTGHGVGSFLNVHEGPQSISHNRDTGWPLEPGNVLSNEPGYYEPGAYGIRIENLVVVQPDTALSNGQPWYHFETITMCPIDTRLVDQGLLSPEDRRWLNDYHKVVYKKVSPLLDGADKAWLRKACAAI